MALFLINGFSQAILDVGGNHIILNLWTGISSSPVNAMHAGYGIGAIISVQLLKPYLKFKPDEDDLNNNTLVNQTMVTSNDIKLQKPYAIASACGMIIIIGFIIAQIFEFQHVKKVIAKNKQQKIALKSSKSLLEDAENKKKPNRFNKIIQKLLFEKEFSSNKDYLISVAQALLLSMLLFSIGAYNTILTAFMLTYATKGPAKYQRNEFLTIQTCFWVFFIAGRFLAAIIGFKIKPLVFFSLLLLANIANITLFIIPILNSNQAFYWYIICALGLCLGPLEPSAYMVAQAIFSKLNASLIAIFLVGLGTGGLVVEYITGILLDKFQPNDNWLGYKNPNSIFIIPIVIFSCVLLCCLSFILIFTLFKCFKNVFHGKIENDN